MKIYATNGIGKAVDLLHSEDPDVWRYFGTAPVNEVTTIYARVAAAYRAVNTVSRAMAKVPFVIMKGKEEIDSSAHWQNEIGFLPDPREIFRRVRMSLSFTNRAYLRMGKNVAGYPKRWNYVMPASIEIETDRQTGELESLSRRVNGQIVKTYKPDDPDLCRFWYLDHDTELLPSANTEFKAAMSAAQILYYADFFTAAFFQRGGVKPVLIAMKGLILSEKKDEAEKDWTNFIKGIGQKARASVAKMFNADAADVRPFGEGLGDLKETPVFRKALEDIAIAMDIPLSLLLSNSANYATAQIEERKFFRDNAVPWFDFCADQMNDQTLGALGYRIESRPETLDPEQEDEVARASAINTFVDFLNKCPNADIALETAATFGYELTEGLVAAIEKHFSKKEEKPKTAPPASTLSPDNSPNQQPDQSTEQQQPAAASPQKAQDGRSAAGWTPSIDELADLKIWRDVALRRWKKIQSMDFEYQPHHGGLPEFVTAEIRTALLKADSMEAIKAAFEVRPAIPAKLEEWKATLEAISKVLMD